MSVCFLLNPGTQTYGALYGFVNFFGAGILVIGEILSYIEVEKWKLVLLTITMSVLTVFNTIWFIMDGTFFQTGFPLIAYNVLFIVAHLHFLGKGLTIRDEIPEGL